MSAHVATFEVRIRIKGDRPIRYHPWKDGVEYKKLLKMLHIEKRTQEQAINEAKKHGEVISCRKLDISMIAGNIESLQLDNAKYVNLNPYKSAVAMDEFIWKKGTKRRKNMVKDRIDY